VIGFGATGTVLIVAALAGLFFLPAIGEPSAKAAHYSLTREVGGTLFEGVYSCSERGADVWRCEVADAHGSGSATFRVSMDGRRCWRATKLTPDAFEEGPPLDDHPKGCVSLRDQVRLYHRMLTTTARERA
jgi:hypothetical protein